MKYNDGEFADNKLAEGELAEGELADEELNGVAGGASMAPSTLRCSFPLQRFRSQQEVQYLFNVGDEAEAFTSPTGGHSVPVRIIERKAETKVGPYYDFYKIEPADKRKPYRFDGWYGRDSFRLY